jgi:uncharacterized membrane protein
MGSTFPDPEVLVGIAALGLTVTGFSGLIAVLGRRQSGQWTEAERFQLSELVGTSLSVTFASFIPILVRTIQTEEKALSTALFLVALFHLAIIIRGTANNFRDGVSNSKVPTKVAAFIIPGGLALVVAAFLASCNLIAGTAFLLVSNLLWLLLVAVVHFVLLLLNSGSTDDA